MAMELEEDERSSNSLFASLMPNILNMTHHFDDSITDQGFQEVDRLGTEVIMERKAMATEESENVRICNPEKKKKEKHNEKIKRRENSKGGGTRRGKRKMGTHVCRRRTPRRTTTGRRVTSTITIVHG